MMMSMRRETSAWNSNFSAPDRGACAAEAAGSTSAGGGSDAAEVCSLQSSKGVAHMQLGLMAIVALNSRLAACCCQRQCL